MEKFTLFLSIFLAIVIFFLILKILDYSKQADKHRVVKWIITDSDVPLFIHRISESMNIPVKCRIETAEEKQALATILSHYKEYILQSYFHNNLPFPDKKSIPGEYVYYMYSLCQFLHDHQCDTVFCGHNMHTERLEYTEYGSWGGPLYDAKYTLSDFSITFHKLYYISYVYCKNNKALNPKDELYRYEKSIENIIDSKTISISRL